ncbi:MAG: hypothetical protein AAB767_01860 [Patescibacteria group bacterium]
MIKILKRIVFWSICAFMALVVYRGIFYVIPKERTDKQVEKIHATRLNLVDVMGKNLPPVPSNPDSSIQGLDANTNGIRDDVELAIFKEYPNSAKTRAVLLQYALALQMEMTQTRVNTGTVVAVAQVGDKASACIGESVPRTDLQKFVDTVQKYSDFVESRQWNTDERLKAKKDFYNGNLDSYSSLDESCDLDLGTLPN